MGKFLNNIAGPLLGFGASIFQNAQNAKRQRQSFDQQKQLMGMQYANQRGLNYQGHELQFDMWQKTNYPAQMAMLKQAGLNPGLLYGQGGAGGATTGSQGGGSASGGSAPSPIPYDLGAGLTAMQTQAQIELAKSQAEKNKAEAEKIKGVDTEEASARILNLQTQERLTHVLADIKESTKNDDIDYATYRVEELIKKNAKTDEETKLIKEQTIGQGIQNALTKVNINKSKAEIDKMTQDIMQGWQKVYNENERLILDSQDNKRKLYDSKRELKRIQYDFILGFISKDIDLMKLNVEQQKIFANMFNNILSSRPTTTNTESWSEKHGHSTTTTKRQ